MKPTPTETGSEMISQVNAYALDPEIFAEGAESWSNWWAMGGDVLEDYTQALATVVRSHGLANDEATTAIMSIMFRLSALNQILQKGGVPGFQQDARTSGHYVDEAVMRAAVAEPLLNQEGPISFDEESFRARVLMEAGTAGRA